MSTKDFSNIQERQIAQYLGWSVVSGSGARPHHVGDVQSDSWLGECKTHVKPGFSINFKSSVWDKIRDEAISKYKYPVLFVDDGSQMIEHTWCMFPNYVGPIGLVVHTLPGCDGVNLYFDDATMRSTFDEMCRSTPDKEYHVVQMNINKKQVFVCPLSMFKYMFER